MSCNIGADIAKDLGIKTPVSIPNRELYELQQAIADEVIEAIQVSIPNRELYELQHATQKERRTRLRSFNP